MGIGDKIIIGVIMAAALFAGINTIRYYTDEDYNQRVHEAAENPTQYLDPWILAIIDP